MREKLREEGTHAVNEDGVYLEDMIMELRLGRALRDNETVFHRNGNTLDNRDANLYVVNCGGDSGMEERTYNQFWNAQFDGQAGAVADAERQGLKYPFEVTLESTDGIGTVYVIPGRGQEPTMVRGYDCARDPESDLAMNIEVREYDLETGQAGLRLVRGRMVRRRVGEL